LVALLRRNSGAQDHYPVAIEGCEWHIKIHPTESGRESFTQMRDQFAAEPDNALFVFKDGECKVFYIGEKDAA